MKAPENLVRVIKGIRYDTSKSTLLAQWIAGSGTFLYRTTNGNYSQALVVDADHISVYPLYPYQAMRVYGECTPVVPFEEAFPGVLVEDA